MIDTTAHDKKFAVMTFAAVYPLYVAKILKKSRTVGELHKVITWLTGYTVEQQQILIAKNVTFEEFFRDAKLNQNASLITGMICGYRIEDIKNTLTRQVRYLDKLVDELAKGRPMDKILRGA
jgi:hypothetical protein